MNRLAKLVLILISFFVLTVISNIKFVDAEELTSTNFDEKVLESEDIWMVNFYTPGCGGLKELQPEWEKAAKNLEGKVKFGEVDCDKNQDLMAFWMVSSVPYILEFRNEKKTVLPTEYKGDRSAAGLEKAALAMLQGVPNAGTNCVQLENWQLKLLLGGLGLLALEADI